MELNNPVIAKVRKLLAVAAAGSGATEAEAQNAAEMAQRILQDNGLTMMQVEAAGGSAGADGKRLKEATDRRALFKWQQALMAALADNNFCMHLIERVRKHDGRKERRSLQHVLIGRWVNVQTTLITYDYLVKAIKRAADEEGFFHAPETEKDHHMFIEGAVERLKQRLHDRRLEEERRQEEERKEREAAAKARANHPGAAPAAPGTALVLTDVYTNEAELNNDMRMGYEPGTTTRRRLENERKSREFDARLQALTESGIEWDVAWYMAHGYTREQADQFWKEEQKRNKRQSRSSGRSSGWTQRDQAKYDRRNSVAYQTGDRRARDIGLDTQLDSRATRVLK